ncbi:MAG: hypothetical protein VB058_03740 [Oscillospiraceae bacterium]|nr:hypothetical protein [Oscillospiraceae bacterium]
MTAARLIAAAPGGPMERLRFRVLREFCVLPGSRAARKMTDRQCLRIAAMLAAERLGGTALPEEENAAFDEARFLKLGGGHG